MSSETIRLQEAKRASQIQLDGIAAELVTDEHDNVQELVLRDSSGHVLRVRYSGFSVKVYVPAPPKTVKRWAVRGKIPGVRDAVLEYFEHEFQATKRRDQLTELVRVDAELEVAEVEVLEEEADRLPGPDERIPLLA